MNRHAPFIQAQRKKRSLTQEFVALQLGLSRPTYVQIEQGERELTVSEAQKLAELFDLSLDDFLASRESAVVVRVEKGSSAHGDGESGRRESTAKAEFRISVPQRNIEKFKEVLLYVLAKVGGKPNVGETVLYKLLYFIDFDFYEKYEEQLMGATYIKNHHGPTPIEFKQIVDEMVQKGEIAHVKGKYFNYPQRKYLPVRDADLTKLKDARELQHIDEVLARLADKNANELSTYSHDDVPWVIAKDGKPLDYEAVFYRTPKTSVRNYDTGDEH